MSDLGDAQAQRLDKWLWAARFFKTRTLAAQAVSGGKVQVDGQRVKPARRIRAGARLSIRRGRLAWEVDVQGLSPQRRPAREAVLLYTETAQSLDRRSNEAARHEQAQARRRRGLGRPTKRDRRALGRFQENDDTRESQ